MNVNLIQKLIVGTATTWCSMLALAQEVPQIAPAWRTPPALGDGPRTAEQLVRVTASADVAQIKPGQTFHLAYLFQIEPKWHIYWINSGASGGPTEVQVTAPQGFTIGKTMYPRPVAFHGEEGVTYGYENQTVLFVEVTAPQELTPGQAMFSAKINWMVCKDICLLGRATQIITLPTRSAERENPFASNNAINPAVMEFKSRLPQPLAGLSGAEAKFEGGVLTIRLPDQDMTTAEFFPIEVPGVTYDQASVQNDANWITITVPVSVNPKDALGNAMRIMGTVGLGDHQTDPSYSFEIALPAT